MRLRAVATAVSLALAPQIYGGIVAYTLWSHFRAGGLEALAVLVATQTVLPLVPILLDAKRGVTDIFVSDRAKRWKYYLLTLASYALGAAYVAARGLAVYAPFYASYALIAAVMAAITLRWKISVHTAGIAGPTTLLVYMLGPSKAYLYALLLPVAWARHKLRAHTPAQLTAGAGLAAVLTLVVCHVMFQ